MNPFPVNNRPVFANNPVEGADKTEALVRAAWLYFMENMTQQEIAERLGISRIKVVRLLKEAREQGVVEIKVHSPITEHLILEGHLRSLFHLADVVVTSREKEGEPLYKMLSWTAAQILEQRLQPGMRIGIGIGRTTSHLPESFAPGKQVDCTFIALAGGLSSRETVEDSYETLLKLARQSGGNAKYIYAPFLVSNSEIRDALIHDNSVGASLEQARNSDLAIFSVGTPDDFALLHQYNLMTAEELSELRSLGAVGDALGRFYDVNGHEIITTFRDRVIGITIDELRTIPTRILVAGGQKKYSAILAALKGELATILVTDAETALWLLEE